MKTPEPQRHLGLKGARALAPPLVRGMAGPLLQALVIAAALLHGPHDLYRRFLGDAQYGAYQGTIWWYVYFTEHLLDPSAWFHSKLGLYPFGFSPYKQYAGDVLAPLLFAPLHLALPLEAATNVFVILALTMSAAAASYVARRLGAVGPVAFLLGLLFVLNPFVLAQVQYGRLSLLLLAPLPLFVLSWTRLLAEGRPRHRVISVLFLVLASLIYTYYGVFLALVAVAALAWEPAPWRRRLKELALLTIPTAALVSPVLLPLLLDYRSFSAFEDDVQLCAPLVSDLPSNFGAVLRQSVTVPDLGRHMAHPLLAVLPIGLAFRGRIRWWSLAGLVAVVLAMGPYLLWPRPEMPLCLSALPLPFWLFLELVPGAATFSHPQRFLTVGHTMGLMVAASLLFRFSGRLLAGWPGQLVAAAGVVVILATGEVVERSERPRYGFTLADVGDGSSPLIILPTHTSDNYLLAQLEHRRPMLNHDGFEVGFKREPAITALMEENALIRLLMSEDLAGPRARRHKPRAADLAFLHEHGFKDVVLMRSREDDRPGPGEALDAILGEPSYDDGLLKVYPLPEP